MPSPIRPKYRRQTKLVNRRDQAADIVSEELAQHFVSSPYPSCSPRPRRAGNPLSLSPLTPAEALRRAMTVPAPKDEPKPTLKGKRKAAPKKARKG
jgi:hypothetical protein